MKGFHLSHEDVVDQREDVVGFIFFLAKLSEAVTA